MTKSTGPIQLFVPKFRTGEVLEAIRPCLDRGWTGLGFKTVEFEQAWMQYTAFPHAHFVNSATAALHLAVAMLKVQGGWRRGDEIITTPLTFVSTNHAILYEGLTPVFADVDRFLCLDPDSVEDRITPRTRAVMFVGLGGNPGQLDRIAALCRERDLKLILDAAHMSGTYLHREHVGPQADVACFSFHAVKNLPTADGGMICFRERALDVEVRRWTWLGIDKDTYARTQGFGEYKWLYEVPNLGFKYHGNSIMAAIGLVSLKYLEADNDYRRRVARWYDEALDQVAGVERVLMAPDCVPSRHLYQVLVDDRDEVMLALNQKGIFPGVHYRDNTDYSMYDYGRGMCPQAHIASERIISLPMHLYLTRDDIERIAEALRYATSERSSQPALAH